MILTAHQELERLVCTIHQNQFKADLDRQWAYLVYAGLWWEPLREDLDAYMDRVNERVTGTIGLKLYKGHVRVVTRSSPNAVYDAALASFAESGGLFSQTASPGFIELFSLQSRMAWRLRNEEPAGVGKSCMARARLPAARPRRVAGRSGGIVRAPLRAAPARVQPRSPLVGALASRRGPRRQPGLAAAQSGLAITTVSVRIVARSSALIAAANSSSSVLAGAAGAAQ